MKQAASILLDGEAHCTRAGRPGGCKADGRARAMLWLQIMGEMSHEHRVERTVISAPGRDSWLERQWTSPDPDDLELVTQCD